MNYRIIRTKVKPIDCGLMDQTCLGPDATYVDLWRWYSTFATIIHNQELIEDLGIPCGGNDPENIGQHIDDWIWSRGEYQDRFDQILGPVES